MSAVCAQQCCCSCTLSGKLIYHIKRINNNTVTVFLELYLYILYCSIMIMSCPKSIMLKNKCMRTQNTGFLDINKTKTLIIICLKNTAKKSVPRHVKLSSLLHFSLDV